MSCIPIQDFSLITLNDAGKAGTPGKLYSIVPDTGDGDFSVTRAGDAATRVNAQGIIETVPAGMPRIDFDPVTGEYLGTLVEPQATNLCPTPNTFTSLNAGVATPNAEIAPDGTMTATRVVFGATINDGCSMNNVTVTSGNVITSVWMKKISGNPVVRIRKDFSANILSSPAFTPTDEWQRFSHVFTSPGADTTTAARLQVITTGTIAIWMENTIQSGTLTSTIASNTSVTRDADVITRTNAADLIGQTGGVVKIDVKRYRVFATSVGRTFFTIFQTDNVLPNRIQLGVNTTGNAFQIIFQSTSSAQTITVPTATFTITDGDYDLELRYTATTYELWVNGTMITNGPITAFPDANLNLIRLGNNPQNVSALGAHIKLTALKTSL